MVSQIIISDLEHCPVCLWCREPIVPTIKHDVAKCLAELMEIIKDDG